jgi:hypothetical protein
VNGWLADRRFGIQVVVVKHRRSTLFLCMIRRLDRQEKFVLFIVSKLRSSDGPSLYTTSRNQNPLPTLIRELTCDVEFTDRLNNIRSAASRNNWKTSRVRGKYFNFICSLTPKMRPPFSPLFFVFFVHSWSERRQHSTRFLTVG